MKPSRFITGYADWREYSCGCVTCFDLAQWKFVTTTECNYHRTLRRQRNKN